MYIEGDVNRISTGKFFNILNILFIMEKRKNFLTLTVMALDQFRVLLVAL